MEKKIITRQRTAVEKTTIYVAKDGKEFSTEEECLRHELIIDGRARICPHCNGKGEAYHREITGYTRPNWHGDAIWEDVWGKCYACNGKGYQLKKVVWE